MADGTVFIEGRNPRKARELVTAAIEAGLGPNVVLARPGGYEVPAELGPKKKTRSKASSAPDPDEGEN